MSHYSEIHRVASVDAADLPISLLLQIRHDVPPEEFYCLSWRTLYPSGRANRRFYYNTRDGFWRVTVPIALELLNRAQAGGMLNERYDDRQVRHQGPDNFVTDSRNLNREDRRREWASITIPEREHTWSADAVFVIIQVPDETWRKIMIVDPKEGVCTFRSTTTVPEYRPIISEGIAPPWRLDNAMQDASAAMMQTFLQVLRSI